MTRLDGKKWEFFGVNENCFQVREVGTSDKRIFEAIEDPGDGYRSSLKDLKEIEAGEAVERNLFFNALPFVTLTARDVEEHFTRDGHNKPPPGVASGLFNGLLFSDDNGHVWLSVGTDNTDDYYPGFVCSYSPAGTATP